MQVGEAFVKVRPDTAGFGGQLRRDVSTQGQSLGQDLGGAISRQLGAVLAGGAAVDFLRQSIGAASDLNEAVSLTEVTFRAASDSVLAMGEDSAQSLGLANDQALSFANSIGGLFVGFGETRGEAAAMAEDVVKLGADLASARNLSGGTAEALEILRSGLVGEVEPLRRVGVALNAAAVEQRALADTGKASAAALTEGEKAAARYGLIVESLGRQGVVGDFERTAGGAANQQRILAAEFRNAQAELGQRLLPAFIDVIGAAREFIPLTSLVADGLAASADSASMLAGALGPLAGILIGANSGLRDFTFQVGNLQDLSIGGVDTITDAFQRMLDVGLQIGPIRFEGPDSDELDLVDDFRGGVDALRAAMELLDLEFGGDSRVSIEEWAEAIESFAIQSGRSFAEALAYVGISGESATAILAAIGPVGESAGAAMGELGDGTRDAAEAAESLDEAWSQLNNNLSDFDAVTGAQSAVLDLQTAFADATAEGGINAEEMLGLRGDLSGLVQAYQTLAEEQNTNAQGTVNVRAAQRQLRAQLGDISAFIPAELRPQWRELTRDILNVPRERPTRPEAPGIRDRQREFQALRDRVQEVPTSRNINVTSNVRDTLTAFQQLPAAIQAAATAADQAQANAARALADMESAALPEFSRARPPVRESTRVRVTESARGGGGGVNVNVNIYPQALISTEEELVRMVAPAVAGAVDEMLRRG